MGHTHGASENFLKKSFKSERDRADVDDVEVNHHRLNPPGIHDPVADFARQSSSAVVGLCP